MENALKQSLTLAIAIVIGAATVPPAAAQESAQARSEPGFYGGVGLRQSGKESLGVSFGHLTSVWGKFASPTVDETASTSRTLFFGGYRWRSDVAVEAAFATTDRLIFQPADTGVRRGVGLSFTPLAEATPRRWNADLYTSWSLKPSLALYGRLGYAQSEALPTYLLATLPAEPRRTRDGVNYGLGLRYDFSPALGLRLEYARFTRFAGESLSGFLPDSDQVQLGLQFRF
jgi:hypothetical protein